jgi:endonuclease YncB( thermonuclease family)
MFKRRSRRSRKRRWLGWWVMWRIPVLLILVMLAWWFIYRPIAANMGDWVEAEHGFDTCGESGRGFACVSDGDTVTLGYGNSTRRIRLTGFDAPEIEGKCPAESAAAVRAQTALREWLNRGAFEWDGGNAPPHDRYGRELRSVRRTLPDGGRETLAQFMIDADLASGPGPWEWQDWCN